LTGSSGSVGSAGSAGSVGAAGSAGSVGSAGVGGSGGAGDLAGAGGSNPPPDGGAAGASDAGKSDGATAGVGGGFPPDCTNAPVATWQKLYAEVIAPNCGKSCHNGGNSTQNGGGMDLFPTDQARAWRNLVTQAVKGGYPCTGKAQYRLACPRNAMGACTGPGDPDKSVIYSKLINKPICGNAEPQGTAAGMLYPKAMPFMALPNNQLCDFYTWIKSGAMDN